jgi:hypothetical protein
MLDKDRNDSALICQLIITPLRSPQLGENPNVNPK